jgi:prostaglandin reductase 1
VLVRHFDGFPKNDDIVLKEENLPALKDGEFLCEAEWQSVDPYMRPYMSRYPLGTTMLGIQVAKVTESRSAKFPVGCHVIGGLGWRTHSVVSDQPRTGLFNNVSKVTEGVQPLSLALGVVGMPGVTGYLGLLELCQPKEGEVVVVSTAAGAVGSVVGQVAKLQGCKVIGYTGTDEKTNWLKSIGFDHAFNYKKVNVYKSLKEVVPEGVDCYFDNVGGDFLENVAKNMKPYGRIAICGHSSVYNLPKGEKPKGNNLSMIALSQQLRVEGFLVDRWIHRFPETLKTLSQLVKEGKIKYEETVYKGFENLPVAFFDLLKGKNTGKMVVNVSVKL